jgi:hypothetical protein
MRAKHKIFNVTLLSILESDRFEKFFNGPLQEWKKGNIDDPFPLLEELQQMFGGSQQRAEMLYRRYRSEDAEILKARRAAKFDREINKELDAASNDDKPDLS